MSNTCVLNENAMRELMVVINRNAQHSACIDNFGDLLNEIKDPEYVNLITSSFFKLLTEVFELFSAVDNVKQKRFKAKMLTTEFIEPMRYFGRVKRMADDMMKLRACIEFMEGSRDSVVTVNTERIPVTVSMAETEMLLNRFIRERHILLEDKYLNFAELRNKFCNSLKDTGAEIKEEARKMMLIWNYIPAVYKAVVQTKRRSLRMDNNSKKFD